MKHPIAATALLAATAVPALAQGVVQYVWDLNDSGSNVAVVPPRETVNLKLYAKWDSDDKVTGFAGTVYEILGIENWGTGVITLHENRLDSLGTGPGDLQANNDILNIEALQLPPLFNPQYWSGYSVFLYEIEWLPIGDAPRTVRLTDANHLNNTFYTDDFGSSIEFEELPGEGATIHIIPAPASALALIGFVLRRRR